MTSTQTPNLDLPYIMPGQAQKHVTHNEAIRRLDAVTHLSVIAMDVSSPVSNPADGARYGLSSSPLDGWSAYPDHLAIWQDNAWVFLEPKEGWTVWIVNEADFRIFSSDAWIPLVPPAPTEFQNLNHMGINATADSQNRLSVSSGASLFNHDGGDHRMKINKNALPDTASVLFQSNFSGRAELGLMGDEALSMKTSVDGLVWQEQIRVEPDMRGIKTPAIRSGNVTVPFEGVATIMTPSPGGIVAITLIDSSGFPQSYHSGLFVYDTGPSLGLYTLAKLHGFDNKSITNLTGTTGVAGQTSISVQAGVLQIENRFSTIREYTYTFLS